MKVAPGDAITLHSKSMSGSKVKPVRIVAPFKEARLRDRLLIQMIRSCPPRLCLCFQLIRLFGLNFQMDNRMICIHPNSRDVLAALDLNFTGFPVSKPA